MRITHKTAAAVVATAVLALGGGGMAYAYFGAGGSGTGSATVGSGPGDVLQISSSGPATPLAPGGDPQSFDVSIHDGGPVAAGVGTVSMAVARYGETGDAATPSGEDIPGCDASWFTVSPSLVVDHAVDADSTVTASGLSLPLPTISMTDSGTDQDACEGATIGIAFTTST